MMKNNFKADSASRMCLYMMILTNDSESTGSSDHDQNIDKGNRDEHTHPPHPPTEPGRTDTDPNRYSDPIEPPTDPTDDEIQEPEIPEMPQREPLDPDEKNPMTETDYLNDPDDDIHTQENRDDFDETEGVTD